MQHQKNICADDPNCFAWYDATHMWTHFLINKNVAIWIMFCNFFFGFLPGILFFSNSVYIASLDAEEIRQTIPVLPRFDVQNIGQWFFYLFILFPVIVSAFQLVVFQRFIAIRLVWTFFMGQMVGMFWYIMTISTSRSIGKLFRQNNIKRVNIIIIAITIVISTLLFVIYINTPWMKSELYFDPSISRYKSKSQTKTQSSSVQNDASSHLLSSTMTL